MGFRKLNGTPVVSARPYAFVKGSQEEFLNGFTVDAYWIGKKSGNTTVSTGKYHLSPEKSGVKFDLLEDAIANTETDYGGRCDFKWDGTVLWSAEPIQESMRGVVIEALDLVLKRFEAGKPLPSNLDGWYVKDRGKLL